MINVNLSAGRFYLLNTDTKIEETLIDFNDFYSNTTNFTMPELLNNYINIIKPYSDIDRYTFTENKLIDALYLTSLVFKKLMQGNYVNINALELGSNLGFFTFFYANTLKVFSDSNHIFSINTWNDLHTNTSNCLLTHENTFDHFRNILKWAKIESMVTSVISDSAVNFSHFPDNYFDIIFINNARDYKHTYMDIVNSIKKLKVGGLLLGSNCECYFNDLPNELLDADYKNSESINGYHIGLIKALNDILGKGYEKNLYGSIWYKFIDKKDKELAKDLSDDKKLLLNKKHIIETSKTLTKSIHFISLNYLELSHNKLESSILDFAKYLNNIEDCLIELYDILANKNLKFLTNNLKSTAINIKINMNEKNQISTLINNLINEFHNWKTAIDEEFS